MNIKISGTEKIQRELDKRVKIVSKNATEGLNEIGLRGVGILKQNSPTISGRLKGSQGYSIEGKVHFPGSESPFEQGDQIDSNDKKDIVFIGTNVNYAWKVENLSKTAAGWMARSFNQLKLQANKIFEKHMKKVVK